MQAENSNDMNFKIIETGSRSVKSLLKRSNPTATAGCPADECIACKGGNMGAVGNCRRSSVTYELWPLRRRRKEYLHWRVVSKPLHYTVIIMNCIL